MEKNILLGDGPLDVPEGKVPLPQAGAEGQPAPETAAESAWAAR